MFHVSLEISFELTTLQNIFMVKYCYQSWIPHDEQTKLRVVRHIRHPKVDDKKYNVSFRHCIHNKLLTLQNMSQNCISSRMFNDSVSITVIYKFHRVKWSINCVMRAVVAFPRLRISFGHVLYNQYFSANWMSIFALQTIT